MNLSGIYFIYITIFSLRSGLIMFIN